MWHRIGNVVLLTLSNGISTPRLLTAERFTNVDDVTHDHAHTRAKMHHCLIGLPQRHIPLCLKKRPKFLRRGWRQKADYFAHTPLDKAGRSLRADSVIHCSSLILHRSNNGTHTSTAGRLLHPATDIDPPLESGRPIPRPAIRPAAHTMHRIAQPSRATRISSQENAPCQQFSNRYAIA